ncbi:putative 25-hydroxycholesterol 7-alpha-hydroxylase [Rhypophila decipiens]|uniref:25-hydroxycholesterol 7-alpha-hydroxylase n=1 Tax=Rhypophila decipiens TaxID=261697 RepID=A0AAN6XYZ0_9PEZI|nr:putative 25-hydroxycholesterol 7-alpha-hydroxylase [Rhypophila decipiens]
MASGFLTTGNPLSGLAMSHPILVATVGTMAVTYMFLASLLRLTQDAKEPPFWSMDFYLPWPLIFPPVTAHASEFAMGGSKEALAIMRADMVTNAGFMHSMKRAIHPALSSGPALDDLTCDALKAMSASLDGIGHQGGDDLGLFGWLRHHILLATSDSVYGPSNPLRDAKNEAAWYTFHPAIMFLMLNLAPLWVFGKAIKARGVMASAFHDYHTKGQFKQGSVYIRLWTEYFVSQGIPVDDIAKFHIGGFFSLIANTTPTAFWMIYRVFSDDSVVRQDYLSETSLNLQEVFRFHGMANSVRVATEDCHLDDGRYLIKKGALVMMPARVQHHLGNGVWGDDESIHKFNLGRFVRKDSSEPARPNPAAAFRGFGGGTSLCPGRHFATSQILVLTAMLLLRFDLIPVGGAGGHWVLPSTKDSSQAEAMEQPDEDIRVRFRSRKEVAGKTWQVSFEEDGGDETALVAEDRLE